MEGRAIAQRIQEIMDRLGLTQQQLAGLLEVSQPAISNYLQGRVPPPGVLLRLARVGGVTVDWLLTGENPPVAASSRVGEPSPVYGTSAALLDLWERLPRSLQKDVLQLLRTLVSELEGSRSNTDDAPETG
ncbi:MAG: XRE family transcriptional regulator [Calditrichaeota bacterium]|nr:MAG: XRE family transcriptional regulator [Calditrichota bacterium]